MASHFRLVLAFHVCLIVGTVLSAPVTYDQRQTGDLNVRIDLNDLKILAFLDSKTLEDYMEYDYFYDYADFTIKPTTSKPTTSSSVEPWHTWPTNPPTSSSTTSKIDSEENVPSANDSTTASSSLSPVQDPTTSKVEISTEISKDSTVEDKIESSSKGEGVVETPKSPPATRGSTKWRTNHPLKLQSLFG